MPQFTLICTDEDETITTKEFQATILTEVVEKTQDFLKGVGYVFDELYVQNDLPTDDTVRFSIDDYSTIYSDVD